MKRKALLQSVLEAGVFLGLPFNSLGTDSSIIQDLINNTKKDTDGSMFNFTTNKIIKN